LRGANACVFGPLALSMPTCPAACCSTIGRKGAGVIRARRVLATLIVTVHICALRTLSVACYGCSSRPERCVTTCRGVDPSLFLIIRSALMTVCCTYSLEWYSSRFEKELYTPRRHAGSNLEAEAEWIHWMMVVSTWTPISTRRVLRNPHKYDRRSSYSGAVGWERNSFICSN